MVYTRSNNIEVNKVLEIINNYRNTVNTGMTNCYHKGMVMEILDQVSHDVQMNVGWDEVPTRERK